MSGVNQARPKNNGKSFNLGTMILLKPLAGSLNQESVVGGYLYSGYGLKTTLRLVSEDSSGDSVEIGQNESIHMNQ